MYGILFTLPSASDLLASTSEYSSPMFNDMLPIAILAVGVFLGLFIIGFIIKTITGMRHHDNFYG